MSYDLMTVGRVSMELIARDVGADFADITGFDAAVGGCPTGIAMGTSRLGLETIAFTGVGDDTVGDFVLRYLRDTGVVTDFVAVKPGRRTAVALMGAQLPDSSPMTAYRDDPADVHLTVDDAAGLPYSETKAVLLSGDAFSRGTCADAARRVAETSTHRGLTVFLDLDLQPTDWSHPHGFGLTLRPILPWVDVLIGTEEEFFALLAPDPGPVATGAAVTAVDREVLAKLIEVLLATGTVAAVVLKRGADGATVLTADDRSDVPGFAVDPVNTAGAGEAFAAGLISSRSRGEDWYRSCRFANACWAIAATRHGSAVALPTEAEVLNLITAAGGF